MTRLGNVQFLFTDAGGIISTDFDAEVALLSDAPCAAGEIRGVAFKGGSVGVLGLHSPFLIVFILSVHITAN